VVNKGMALGNERFKTEIGLADDSQKMGRPVGWLAEGKSG